MSYITRQYPLEFRKQRQELQNCGKYQSCRKFLREDFAIQITLDCRTTFAVDFKSVLGLNAYFPKRKLAIEVDEQRHNNRNTFCEIERQKTLEKELVCCVFIRINPAKENLKI